MYVNGSGISLFLYYICKSEAICKFNIYNLYLLYLFNLFNLFFKIHFLFDKKIIFKNILLKVV